MDYSLGAEFSEAGNWVISYEGIIDNEISRDKSETIYPVSLSGEMSNLKFS